MKNTLTMLCICMAGLAFAQANLVGNGDFQTVTGTLDCSSLGNPGLCSNDDENFMNDYWSQSAPWVIPRKKTFPCINCVATSDHNCDGSNVYAVVRNHEYICQELAQPLVAGEQYLIQFKMKAGGAVEDAGVRFSNERPKQCAYNDLNIDGQPHAEIDNAYVFNWNEWQTVTMLYTADNNYSWITIGTFELDAETEQVIYLDDILLMNWASSDCPPEVYVENRLYPVTTAVQKAADKLYAGYDLGVPSPDGDVTIPADAFISFKAGQEVGLFHGFGAVYGSEFRAYNAPCNSECLPPDAFAGISQSICDGQPIELGAGAMSGYGYAWTADPAAAVSYLSSATVSDPVFTPPAGEGDITYYVTVTNTCGQQSTGEVTIHYDDSPSPVAQFTVSNTSLGDVPSFDLQLNTDIETIYIEVLDAVLNTVYYQELFRNPIDFQCCFMSWALPYSLSPCTDYKIRITVTNFCTGATAQQIIDWNRNRVFALTAPIPNVITPNGDGINDQFCVSFTGAVQISLEVKASSGVTVFYTSTPVLPASACIWNGECNQGLPACVNGPLEDGTYYYILKFFDCAGVSYDYTGFITLLNGGNRMQQEAEDTSLVARGFSLFPNPTSGRFVIASGSEAGTAATVTVYNALGELIITQAVAPGSSYVEIDLSGEAPGIYYVNYFSGGEMRSERVVMERRQ